MGKHLAACIGSELESFSCHSSSSTMKASNRSNLNDGSATEFKHLPKRLQSDTAAAPSKRKWSRWREQLYALEQCTDTAEGCHSPPVQQGTSCRNLWCLSSSRHNVPIQQAQEKTSIVDSAYASSIQQSPLNHVPKGSLGLGQWRHQSFDHHEGSRDTL